MELDCTTELRLGPPGTTTTTSSSSSETKRPSAKRTLDDSRSEASGTGPAAVEDDQDNTTAAKAQVVGWPPVRAYRRNTFQAAAAKKAEQLYVKVSMDGAPYLRKVDLRMYKGYRELREALDVLFCNKSSFPASASAAGDQLAVAYEDKDGDLMLVGDVPWE